MHSELFANIPDVLSCGYRLGTFHVYCKRGSAESNNNLHKQIKKILDKNNIFDFVLRFEPVTNRKFCNHGVGSKIGCKNKALGVLGGFAFKGIDKKLCGITAWHVTEPVIQSGSDVQVLNHGTNEFINFGTVLQPTQLDVVSLRPVDISAILIYDHIASTCEIRFKSQSNVYVASHLFQTTNRAQLPGRIVHISRADSEPSVGKVTHVDLHDRKSRYVIIEDLASSDEDEDQDGQQQPFAKQGDSGSISCADNPDGDSVDVISILSGSKGDNAENDPDSSRRKYYTFYVEEGLNQLHDEQGEDFKLC